MTTGSGFTTSEVPISQHADQISSLWRRNLGDLDEDTASAKLRLGYIDNPAGHGVGIVLRDQSSDSESPAGVICVHPRRIHLGDRVVAGGNLADYAVESAYRTLGPALMLMKKALAIGRERLELLYGLPNAKSGAVCRRAGMSTIGEFRRYARVLSSHHPRVESLAPAVVRPLSPLLNQALAVVERVRSLTLGPALKPEPVGFDHPGLDEIWARRPRDLLLSERSSGMLMWRYGVIGRGAWQLTLFRDRKGTPHGYVVWRMHDGFAEVGDFFTPDPARLTAPVIGRFCRMAQSLGAWGVNVRFFGAPAVEAGLLKAGLSRREDDRLVVLDTPAQADRQYTEAALWYLTEFDNDAN